MLKRIENVISTKWFTMLLVGLTFVFWILQDRNSTSLGVWTIAAYSFFALSITVLLVFFENTGHIIQFALCALFVTGVSQTEAFTMDTVNNAPYLIILVVLIASALIFHFIRFKVKINFGVLTIGLVLIALGYILSFTINDNTKSNMGLYILQTLMGPAYLIIYLFFVSTIKNNRLKDFMFVLFMIGVLISMQFITEYIRSMLFYKDYANLSGIFEMLKYGIGCDWWKFNLGYGIINDGVMFLAFFIPASAYFICKKEHTILMVIVFFLQLGLALLSMSRAGIIGILLATILSTIMVFRRASKSSKIVFTVLFGAFMVGVIIWGSPIKMIANEIGKFGSESLEDILGSRYELYRMAIEEFIKRPIVGGGLFANISDGTLIDHGNRPIVYHSTLFHALGTMGLFGLGALIFHLVQVTKLFKKNRSSETVFLAIGLIATHIHGLIDNTFYMLNYMMVTILIYVAVEKNDVTSQELRVEMEQ